MTARAAPSVWLAKLLVSALALAAWQLAHILLLFFGGIVIAMPLRHAASGTSRLLPLPRGPTWGSPCSGQWPP